MTNQTATVLAEQDSARRIVRVVQGLPATDGAGVKLTRVIAQPALPQLDPFLLLDAFRSDRPGDYVAGFPAHPHRGFEAVSYLLAGRVRHRDSAGHEGVIEPGGVQWMTAGRGIVHSEMPEQVDGLLHGFQLWINLPAAHKMDPPAYQQHSPMAIPQERGPDGALVRVVAGQTARGTRGPVSQPLTEPLFLDVELPAAGEFVESLPAGHNAFIYVIDGTLQAADAAGAPVQVATSQLAVLSQGEQLTLVAGHSGARFLLVAGRPLNEPVARGGPFVMNDQTEIRQAYADYEAGRF